jgi:phospholipase/carboxylesterase
MAPNDPHRDAQVRSAGANLRDAFGVMVLLHGRGGAASDILSLGRELAPREMALLAPEAAGHTWYPKSFLAPLAENEPYLSSALGLIETLIERTESEGISSGRIILCGFSQGACLATEYVARHPRRYAALIALTGGLIGPPGSDLRHPGSLDGTPALFSSGDPDPHVPWARVEESAAELRTMHAEVQTRRYPGRPHTILPEELEMARALVQQIFTGRSA